MRDGRLAISLNFDFPLSNWQPIRKAARFDSKKFRRFVKENFPCIRTGVISEANDFAHGVNGKSKNKTASDLIGFPLRHDIHLRELHNDFGGNTVKWAEHFGIDLQAQLKRQARAYAAHLNVTGSFDTFESLEIAFLQAEKTYRRQHDT